MKARPLLRTLHPPKPCHRAFTSSPTRRAATTLSAKDAASQMLEAYAGSSSVRRQLIDGNQLQKLGFTLGRPIAAASMKEPDATPPADTLVPPGHHLVYFTPNGLETELGKDGTDVSFNPPAPFTRRMWAGGKMSWPSLADNHSGQPVDLGRLRVGDEASETTRLLSATPKKSRTGEEMILVEVEKEIKTKSQGLAVLDKRSWIFRKELDPTTQAQPPRLPSDANLRAPSEVRDETNPDGKITARSLRWSPTALFRFSALTFNGHKIHYNEDWTRAVEGHPGVVVHGPLNLICILDYWRDAHGKGLGLYVPRDIIYKAIAPIYAGEEYRIYTEGEGPSEGGEGQAWDIVAEKKGVVCMRARISI